MYEKNFLCPVDELGKLIKIVDYLLIYATETIGTKVWETSYLLNCLVDYVILERSQGTFNTQQNFTQHKDQSVAFWKCIEINKEWLMTKSLECLIFCATPLKFTK